VRTRRIERLLLGAGLMLLSVWLAARFHTTISSRAAIAEFESENTAELSSMVSASPDPVLGMPVDFRLWSTKRISAYEDSLSKKADAPLAILRIPKISLEVPVFNDTDDLTLNRGVGRILGTAQIGRPGNLGIAGHRDGFFRGLKDIELGDAIELARPGAIDRYGVSQIQIVEPTDTYVLEAGPRPTLTLVTCFPFYYVGSAPKRYVVTASIENSSQRNQMASEVSITTGKNTSNKEKIK
jgi:sortase A